MEIIPLNKLSFPSIRLNYDIDKSLSLVKDNFENEQNVELFLYDFFKEGRDSSSNKYSNFFLTDRDNLTDKVEIRSLENPKIDVFTTWLASDADQTLNTKTDYWVTEDVEGDVVTVEAAASGIFTQIDNRYIFDIYLLDDTKCRIGHTYNYNTRYLTINYLNATGSYFCLDNGQDPFDANSTQTFFYLYDKSNDFIVFYKLINDIAYILQTDESTKNLTLVIPPTSDDFGFTADQIYRCRPRYEIINQPKVANNWIVYEKNTLNNDLIVDDKPSPLNELSPSFLGINTNCLLNTEYYRLSGKNLPVNILTLKNTNTPENYQSRNNPFVVREDEVLMRQYRKLFTGANQTGGHDNIAVSYEAYTSQRIFDPDKLTYFHAPQDIFPYQQLNIKDTGLIESGAIAGNHPLKADKIFKKQANYKYNSSFGNTLDEQSGTFLCTWLSGAENSDTRPIWIDRYYFPERASFLTALTSQTYFYINYKSKDDCLRQEIPQQNQVVVDIPSRFVFEPGILYAYHHVGKKTTNALISALQDHLFETNMTLYRNTTYDFLSGTQIQNEGVEYIFDGYRYGKSNKITFPNILNQFTVSFYMKANNWKDQFGHQIIGNYINDGFCINNTNYITPFIYFSSPSAIEVYNTDLQFIEKKSFNTGVNNVVRYDQLEDYFVFLNSNSAIRCDTNNVSLDVVSFPRLSSTRAVYPFNNNYVLVLTGGLQDDFYLVNTDTNMLSTASAVGFNKFYVNFTGTGYQSIVYTKNSGNQQGVYLIQGKSPRVLRDNIYFAGTAGIFANKLFKYNTLTKKYTSAFSFANLTDLNIGFDENIYAVHDFNKITKIDQNNNVLFTKTYNLSNFRFERIDLLSYFQGDEHKLELLLLSRSTATSAYRADKLDYNGNIITTVELPESLTASFFDTTGGDYARYYTYYAYPKNSLTAKIKMRNVYNYTDVQRLELNYNLSGVDIGYHHVAVRVDPFKGIFSFYFDGVLVRNTYFSQNNYTFTNFLKEPFVYGSTAFFNNILLFEQLKQKDTFLCNNIQLKNINIYNYPLDFCDINLFTKQGLEFEKIIFDIPSGRRTFLDEIEYVFKNKIPGYKTGVFDLEVKNSGIINSELKIILEKNIKQVLSKILPTYTKLRNIIWSEYDES